MPKKRTKPVVAVPQTKPKPVRLELSEADHERLRGLAQKRRLSMASYARMKLVEAMDAEESAAGAK